MPAWEGGGWEGEGGGGKGWCMVLVARPPGRTRWSHLRRYRHPIFNFQSKPARCQSQLWVCQQPIASIQSSTHLHCDHPLAAVGAVHTHAALCLNPQPCQGGRDVCDLGCGLAISQPLKLACLAVRLRLGGGGVVVVGVGLGVAPAQRSTAAQHTAWRNEGGKQRRAHSSIKATANCV